MIIMPNRKFHQRTGTLAGGVAACIASNGQPDLYRCVETVGGALVGHLAASLPDVLDPPDTPRHRSVAHGILPIAGLATWIIQNMQRGQDWLRQKASEHEALARREPSAVRRLWHALLALLYRLLAGGLAGLVATYVAHLGLDAATPDGLPLVA